MAHLITLSDDSDNEQLLDAYSHEGEPLETGLDSDGPCTRGSSTWFGNWTTRVGDRAVDLQLLVLCGGASRAFRSARAAPKKTGSDFRHPVCPEHSG
jgi:hypothetical protein